MEVQSYSTFDGKLKKFVYDILGFGKNRKIIEKKSVTVEEAEMNLKLNKENFSEIKARYKTSNVAHLIPKKKTITIEKPARPSKNLAPKDAS